MTARTGEHWAAFNDHQAGRPTRPLFDQVTALAGDGRHRDATDLGCGAGVETRALLRAGWRVRAIDPAPGTRERVLATVGDTDAALLTIEVTDLGAVTTLGPADLVYAGYSLPYVHPRHFDRVWGLVRAGLRPGGWLAVNLLGERDSWADNPAETYLSEDAARALFDGLDLVHFAERDEDGPAYSGDKHWHVFDIIARAV